MTGEKSQESREKRSRLKKELENRKGFANKAHTVSPFLNFKAKIEMLQMHSSIFFFFLAIISLNTAVLVDTEDQIFVCRGTAGWVRVGSGVMHSLWERSVDSSL